MLSCPFLFWKAYTACSLLTFYTIYTKKNIHQQINSLDEVACSSRELWKGSIDMRWLYFSGEKYLFLHFKRFPDNKISLQQVTCCTLDLSEWQPQACNNTIVITYDDKKENSIIGESFRKPSSMLHVCINTHNELHTYVWSYFCLVFSSIRFPIGYFLMAYFYCIF